MYVVQRQCLFKNQLWKIVNSVDIYREECCWKEREICKKSNTTKQDKIRQAVCLLPHPRLSASFWEVLRSVHLCTFDSKSVATREEIFLSQLCPFLVPSCDVWPKISENLLWIFPGSNWLNPEGQGCQSRSWQVSMKCPSHCWDIFDIYHSNRILFLHFPLFKMILICETCMINDIMSHTLHWWDISSNYILTFLTLIVACVN